MLSLKRLLFEQGVVLKPIQPAESDFGPGYDSSFVKGEEKYMKILMPVNTEVGELQYGETGPKSIEIISIHFNKEHRGKGYGSQAINALVQMLNLKQIITQPSPSSKAFWRRIGFGPMQGDSRYFIKQFK